MKRIATTRDIVEYILYTNEATRGSDRLLACEVYKFCGADVNRPFNEIMLNAELPPFESIRRNRALIQAERPELKPTPEVQAWRNESREIVKEYVTNGRV